MPLIVSGCLSPCVKRLRGLEQIDERDVVGLGDLGHRLRCTVRSRSLFALPSGRLRSCRSSWAMGEKSTSRGALLPLYFWLRRVLDEASQIVLELGEPRLAGERFVVAEEGEDHVGLDAARAIRRACRNWREPRSPLDAVRLRRRRSRGCGRPARAWGSGLQRTFPASRRAACGRPACCR